MKNHFKKFFTSLCIFTLALGLLAYILSVLLPAAYISPLLPYMFPYFLLLTLLVFFILTKETKKSFSNFVNRFMLATFGKMIVSIIVMLCYVFSYRADAVPFILSFFILYILFSLYEVVALLKYPFQK